MKLTGSKSIRLGIVCLLALLIFNGLLSYRAVRILRQRRADVRRLYEDRQELEQYFSLLKDAETSQRGFIYTGDEDYLRPYNEALPRLTEQLGDVRARFRATPENAELSSRFSMLVLKKLNELAETIELRRSGKNTAVRDIVTAGTGNELMEDIRTVIGRMEAGQQRQVDEFVDRQQEADSYLVATLAFASGTAFLFVLFFAAALERESRRVHELQAAEKLATTGRMAATVAHEINNPLEAATNLIYLSATDHGTPQNVKEMLDMADRELSRVAHMTKQTLGFYKSATLAEEFSVADMLDEVVRLFDSKLRGKNLSVRKKYGDGGLIETNRGEFFQVVTNLLSNAIDASYPSGVITLGAETTPIGTSISVEDNGTGISQQVEATMFNAFVTTKKDVGTGLGLWVADKLVSKAGGRISVQSTAAGRKGSVFTVWLPAALKSRPGRSVFTSGA